MKTWDEAIKACDKNDPLEGQIDIFGNTYKKPEKNTLKKYRFSFIVNGSDYRQYETVEAYSKSQALAYLKELNHKRGYHKLFDIREE